MTVSTFFMLYTALMGNRIPHVRRVIPEKSHRSIRPNRRNVTASRPILSTSSGSLVCIKGGNQPNKESDIRGGGLSPTWYLTLGS